MQSDFSNLREDNGFIHNMIMSDEAHYHLNGFINKQNCKSWSTVNPRQKQY